MTYYFRFRSRFEGGGSFLRNIYSVRTSGGRDSSIRKRNVVISERQAQFKKIRCSSVVYIRSLKLFVIKKFQMNTELIICLDQRMGKDALLALASSFTFKRSGSSCFLRNIWKNREAPFGESNSFALPRKKLRISTIAPTDCIKSLKQ